MENPTEKDKEGAIAYSEEDLSSPNWNASLLPGRFEPEAIYLNTGVQTHRSPIGHLDKEKAVLSYRVVVSGVKPPRFGRLF